MSFENTQIESELRALVINAISCSELEEQITPGEDKVIPTPDQKLENHLSNIPNDQSVQEFQHLKLNAELLTNLKSNGNIKPTELQSRVLFPLIQGKSMFIESQPGTGKLTALSILLLQRCRLNSMKLQGVVITGNVSYSSKLEQSLSLLSEEVTVINLDEIEESEAGEIADHQFMIGSEKSLALLCGIIGSIKTATVLSLYNVSSPCLHNVVTEKLILKFNQIVLMRDQRAPIEYELVAKLLKPDTLYLSLGIACADQLSTIFHASNQQTEDTPLPEVNNNKDTAPQEEHQETPNLEILRKLESGEKIIQFFLKHSLSLNIPTFYIFVLNYLFTGVSVVQTGYKSVERINLISLIAKEFDRHLTLPVQVVICHDGKELNDTKLAANPSVYNFNNEETLNDIPKEKTIIIASSIKTLSVLKSFPKLFQSTGRIIILYNISADRFTCISQLFPRGALFLAMLSCQIGSIADHIHIPFVHVTRHESRLNINPYSGAKISPNDVTCLEELTQEKSISPRKVNTSRQPKSRFPVRAREDNQFEDTHTMPHIVSINLLRTISAKHSINPDGMLPFYPEMFSFSIRGDNVVLVGFSQAEYTPIVNIVSLERANSGDEPGCQVIVYYGVGVDPVLCGYPTCKRLMLPNNEATLLDVCPLIAVDSIQAIKHLYATQNAKFHAFRKLVVLVGVTFDECIELMADQVPCQLLLVLTDTPSDQYFTGVPISFVRFLNENNSVRIEKVGRESSIPGREDLSPYFKDETPSSISTNISADIPTHSGNVSQQEYHSSQPSLVRTILDKYQTEIVENIEFFSTVLSHTASGDNIVIREFSKEIITNFVTILYQDYCLNNPGSCYSLFCLGSRISSLLSPSFKCPSSLWLEDNKSISTQPSAAKETYFLTIAKFNNICSTNLDCLVSRSWLVVFIGLSHKEIETCIPYIPLSNQYIFILDITHPQFDKFMSAPHVCLSQTRRKLVLSKWVHKNKMKSFITDYKQTTTTTTTTTTTSISTDLEIKNIISALHDVCSSLLNSGKHILLQAARETGKTTLIFDYTIYNIDRDNKCIQAIFSSPSIFSSVKVFTLLNEHLMRNNETDVKAFLHAKGSISQLSSYLAKAGFHVLVTTNDSLERLLKEPGIVRKCGLLVFDELYGSNSIDDVSAILPTLIHDSIPRDVQCICITSCSENATSLLQIIPNPCYHIQQVDNSSFFIDCNF